MPKIIYEDNDIIIVIKPSGISSQDGPNSLPQKLREITKEEYIAVLHRLDTSVSGIMVYAKSKNAAADISKQIINGDFSKEYLTVIAGCPENAEGVYEDLLFKDSSKNKSYVVKRERKGVKKAILNYSVINTVHLDNGDISLVRVKLITGRTHQIRVQFSSRKMSILGDKKYGSRFNCPIALFSHKITFTHPTTKKSVTFEATPDYNIFPFNKFKKEP